MSIVKFEFANYDTPICYVYSRKYLVNRGWP